MPDASGKKLIQFVTAARGNLALAAERAGLSQADLVATIVGDSEGQTLTESLRTLLIISSFEVLMELQTQLRVSLDELKPEEISRAYGSQLSTVQAMLKAPTPEVSDEAPMDASMAKQRIISRLDNYRKREQAETDDSVSNVELQRSS